MSKRRLSLKKPKLNFKKVKQKLSGLRRGGRKRRLHAWGRVKTVCIWMLLAGNIALLAVFGAVKGYDWYLSVQTRQQIDAKLAEKGILCGSSVYHTLADCPQPYTLRTDHAVQKAFAQALLTGDPTSYAEKGNTTVWVGDNGSVSWAASGDVNASVTLGSIPEPQTEEQAQQIVQDVLDGADIRVRSSSFTVMQDETGYTVEVSQELGQAELLGCSLKFCIAPGNVVTVTGKWCTGEVQPLKVRALSSYSPAHMIFALVSAQSDIVQIVSAQPVYVLSDRSGGRFTAIPCWRFLTDDGDYVLNILSGDVVSAEELEGAADTADGDTADDTDAGDTGTDIDTGYDADTSADTDTDYDTETDTGTDTGTGADADPGADMNNGAVG
ncbi:MAG: hypothetical protein Q4P20_04960 [Eubacteriales bacterium]|nr:hypothetical protein [Eubacteriales bacterium]